MKQNMDGFLDRVLNVAKEFVKLNEEGKKLKAMALINIMEKAGFPEVADAIREKGLPSEIYISSDLHKGLKGYLEEYSTVYESDTLEGAILFSWCDPRLN